MLQEAFTHLPAASLRAALVRSCQPGPSSWKYPSTSRSMRIVTVSFAWNERSLRRLFDWLRCCLPEGRLGSLQ